MLQSKIKSRLNDLSSIRILGIKHFFIIDTSDSVARIVLFKINSKLFNFNSIWKIPSYNILSQRDIDIKEDIHYLDREIKILADNYNISNAILVLIINKYKHFTISLPSELNDSDEDSPVEELIWKQLPANLNKEEFIYNWNKAGQGDAIDNYVVTITRKQDIIKYSDIINNRIFRLRFATPALFCLTEQKLNAEEISSFVSLEQDRITHYQRTENKISEDEFFIGSSVEDEYVISLTEKFRELINTIIQSNSDKKLIIKFNIRAELIPIVSEMIKQINAESGKKVQYEYGYELKHKYALISLSNDSILNFNIEEYFPAEQKYDIEKTLTTRLVITAFSVLLALLLLLNCMNWIADSWFEELSTENQNSKALELKINELNNNTEQLISDVKSINSIQLQRDKISGLLKILSTATIENLSLTNLKLKKNEGMYHVTLNGESLSKDEVIFFIKNLEGFSELTNIELQRMDKKTEMYSATKENKSRIQFSINMAYEIKRPKV